MNGEVINKLFFDIIMFMYVYKKMGKLRGVNMCNVLQGSYIWVFISGIRFVINIFFNISMAS